MTCAYLAFTSKGLALARKLAAAQPGAVARCGENGVTLANWTAAQFAQSDALVFVGAVGIAVRAIAPHCRSKATDPAVVVLDAVSYTHLDVYKRQVLPYILPEGESLRAVFGFAYP